ncbi:hypothetical protein [Pseudomonas sp. P867]|uniref:hypothetical protein n=1 Tax=Pseudomonas sp. P867 TaxID=2816050 RepID=UPI00325FB670
MFAIKLNLILLGALLYLVCSGCRFFWIGVLLLTDGETADVLYDFVSTCGWMLITFSLVIHIIKKRGPRRPAGDKHGNRGPLRRRVR